MKLLLDTHAFIWFVFNAPELPTPTRELLEDAATELHFSHASIWEMSIKVSIGKLSFTEAVIDLVNRQVKQDDIELLPIKIAHLALIETMPLHHKDPFDRLLITQAQAENLPVVSIDTAFDRYGVSRLWLV